MPDLKRYPLKAARYLESSGVVEGWLSATSAKIIAHLGQHQTMVSVRGDVCEIGIHHGKLFILLANLLLPSERGVAVDVFSDQHKNIDWSGRGDREIFENHLKQFAPDARVEIIQESSLDLPGTEFCKNEFRLMSIDGGHSSQTVLNDLGLTDHCLVEGGIAIVDDILSPHWLGVMTAVSHYICNGGRLRPFAISPNKLYMTTSLSFEKIYRKELRLVFSEFFEKPDVEFFGAKLDIYGEQKV